MLDRYGRSQSYQVGELPPKYGAHPLHQHLGNLNVIFSFCREINGEKKNFCLVTNPRKKLKYRMFTEVES